MKMLGSIFFLPAAMLTVLRSDVTPYRIMSVDEINQIRQEAASQAVVQAPPTQPTHDGSWMWDPKYRTSLEKTTVIGRPEAAKSRDY